MSEIRKASGGYDGDVAVVSDDFFDGVRDRVEGPASPSGATVSVPSNRRADKR